MSQQLPPLIQQAVRRFIRAFAPDKIILFGSTAKGTANARSDVDLLIVADLPGDSTIHNRRARQLASDGFPKVDVVFATPQEVASAATANSHFLASILESGITIYQQT
jgi:predicted nucleotidyltransferase